MGEQSSLDKSFVIAKWAVREAWEKVRANRGAAGVDGQSIAAFEKDLRNNLYKIWNRMSSGTYFPPPVRAVEIPKAAGKGIRTLGVPTVADRVAQTVAAKVIEERAEKVFHPDSFGYRPGRSALDAVAACRQRCRERDWVVELDIKSFFDTVPHDLALKAMASVCDLPWVLLYVRRWLTAAVQRPDGTVEGRGLGTPQGSAVSPVIANLFLHWAFDMWLVREFPAVRFERYADDAVLHCVTRRQAEQVLAALHERMAEVGLELHPDKTRIAYCQDDKRRGSHEYTGFTFLGFDFQARTVPVPGRLPFRSFGPAVSKEAMKKMGRVVRSWRLHRHTDLTEVDLAQWINPVVRGWMQYYGAFFRSALHPLLTRINAYLMRWLRNKYKRLRGWKKAIQAWEQAVKRRPRFFAQWAWTTNAAIAW